MCPIIPQSQFNAECCGWLFFTLTGLKIKKPFWTLFLQKTHFYQSSKCSIKVKNPTKYEAKLYTAVDEKDLRRAVSTCFVYLFQWCVTHLAGRLGSIWRASLCYWLWLGSTSGGCGNLEPSPNRRPSPTLTTDIYKKNMEPHSQKSDRRYLHFVLFVCILKSFVFVCLQFGSHLGLLGWLW